MSQDTEMNDRISPTSDRGTNSNPRNDWHQGHGTGYGPRATGTSSRTGFQNEHSQYPQRNTITCFRCGEQGHIHMACLVPEVYCNNCRTPNHSTKACKRYVVRRYRGAHFYGKLRVFPAIWWVMGVY